MYKNHLTNEMGKGHLCHSQSNHIQAKKWTATLRCTRADRYLIKPARAVLEQQGWLILQITGKLTFHTNLELRSEKVHPCSSNYTSNKSIDGINSVWCQACILSFLWSGSSYPYTWQTLELYIIKLYLQLLSSVHHIIMAHGWVQQAPVGLTII